MRAPSWLFGCVTAASLLGCHHHSRDLQNANGSGSASADMAVADPTAPTPIAGNATATAFQPMPAPQNGAAPASAATVDPNAGNAGTAAAPVAISPGAEPTRTVIIVPGAIANTPLDAATDGAEPLTEITRGGPTAVADAAVPAGTIMPAPINLDPGAPAQ